MSSSPKWQYFVHSTNEYNMFNILKTGAIKKREDHEEPDVDCVPAVYCHYLFDQLPSPKNTREWYEWSYDSYGMCIIAVIDVAVSKDLEMFVCDSMSSGNCIENKERRIMHTMGNRQKIPPLSKLRTHILNRMEKSKKNKIISYVTSHECLFFSNIPIRYIRAILVPDMFLDINETNKSDFIEIVGEKVGTTITNNYKKCIDYIKNNNLPIKIIGYDIKSEKNFHDYLGQI